MYYYPGDIWNSSKIQLKFDEIIKILENKFNIKEKDTIIKYHNEIIKSLQQQIQEYMKNNKDSSWITDLPTLKYLLLYLIENLQVKTQII